MLIVPLYFPVDLPHENETNGYIFIHAEGGLNQQRIAVWVVLSIVIRSSPDCFLFFEMHLEFCMFTVACFLFNGHDYLVDWYSLVGNFYSCCPICEFYVLWTDCYNWKGA